MSLISTLPTGVIEHLNPQFLIYGYEVLCKCTLDMPIMVIYLSFLFYMFSSDSHSSETVKGIKYSKLVHQKVYVREVH